MRVEDGPGERRLRSAATRVDVYGHAGVEECESREPRSAPAKRNRGKRKEP